MAGANGYFPAKRYNQRIEEYERAALEYHAVNLILSIILFLAAEARNIDSDFARMPISRIRKIASRNRDALYTAKIIQLQLCPSTRYRLLPPPQRNE